MEDNTKKLRTLLEQNASRYSETVVYRDWVETVAYAIHQSVHYTKDVEKKFIAIFGKYKTEEKARFSQALGELILLFEKDIRDWLGYEYMRQGGSAKTGQFFTPYHISEMIASLQEPLDQETIEEPACGGGSMILARAKYLKSRGINYQNTMRVTAIDIDRHCAMMAYVQLSFAGIPAKVIHGNALTGEVHSCWYTPMYKDKGCDF